MFRVFSLVMLGASVVAMGAAMVLGTSAAVPYFGPTAPFLTLGGSPSQATVTALTWFAAVSGGAGTLTGLYALRPGPFVSPGGLPPPGAAPAGVPAALPPAGWGGMVHYGDYGGVAHPGPGPHSPTPFLR